MLFGIGYNLKRGGDQVTQIMEGNGMEVVPRAPRIQGVRKRRRLSAEDKYQIFQEASQADVPVAAVLRKWGIYSSDLARIKEQVRRGALEV